MTLVEQAQEFATTAHVGQMRKYVFSPYIVHPAAVVDILRSVGVTDEVALAAGWLHDVVEDCEVPIWRIERTFGYDVADVVFALSDPPTVKNGPKREVRKAETRLRIYKGDWRVHDIKCADMLDNWTTIAQYDPHFAVTYMRELGLLIPYLTKARPQLQSMVRLMLQTYENELLNKALAAKAIFNGG